MYHSPLISIITPSYNTARYISETIESVLQQSYLNWELIIIDDCSTDDSQNIIDDYVLNDKRIKVLYNAHNMGAAKSRNRGIEMAKGKYIAFLDSDDIWLPLKLEKQIALMEEKNILLSYTAYYTMNSQGHTIGLFSVKNKVNYHSLLQTSSIGTLTTIYNAEKLGKFYFEDIGHEDYVMKLQILKQIDFAQGINEPLAQYRIIENSLSSNKIKTALWQWHIYRNIEKLSLLKSIFYFVSYTYHGLTKYKKIN